MPPSAAAPAAVGSEDDEWDLNEPDQAAEFLMEMIEDRDCKAVKIDPANKRRLVQFVLKKLLAQFRAQKKGETKMELSAVLRKDIGKAADSNTARRAWIQKWWEWRVTTMAPKKKR